VRPALDVRSRELVSANEQAGLGLWLLIWLNPTRLAAYTSLSGAKHWDHPRLVIRMAAEGLLRRYDFRTGSAPTTANCLTRDHIAPADDPMSRLFAMFWQKQPRSLEDAQAWIDQNWNIAASERIVLDEDGAWLERLSSEIGRIYAFHVGKLSAGFGI
jgi:hypothetical protein